MTDRGTLRETYAAALQHGLVELPSGALKLGVVRRPTRWLQPQIDENAPALGPPNELLDEFRERVDQLTSEGLSEATAHNTAWKDVDYDARYLAYLDESDAARTAIHQVRETLESGTDVVLVCFENTETKRCHRTLLLDEIEG